MHLNTYATRNPPIRFCEKNPTLPKIELNISPNRLALPPQPSPPPHPKDSKEPMSVLSGPVRPSVCRLPNKRT